MRLLCRLFLVSALFVTAAAVGGCRGEGEERPIDGHVSVFVPRTG